MKFPEAMPTITAIQRTNALLVAIATGLLAYLDSRGAAIGCLLGGVVVIANLWLLAALGRMLLAAAGAGISGLRAKIGVAALPLKLLLFVVLIYLLFARIHVDALGFGLGVLTQFVAIIIETGRASLTGRVRPARAE